MNIRIAQTDSEIAACYPVMRELRPHIDPHEVVPRVRRQQEDGYCLAFLADRGGPVAVAGIRPAESLSSGRFLYVDDLVTSATHRSKGYGGRLLSWLREHAATLGCAQLHLDSDLQREDAHRFYEREGMSRAGLHFVLHVTPDNAP